MRSILRFVILVFVLFVSFSPPIWGDQEQQNHWLLTPFKDFYLDTKHIALSPLNWDKQKGFTFLTILATTGGLFLADPNIRESIQENRNSSLNLVSDGITRFGSTRYSNYIIGTFFLGGVILHNPKASQTALCGLESVLISQGITRGFKYLVGRSRPFANQGAYSFNGLRFPPHEYSLSFPSGHSSTAFALASVIAKQYDNLLIDFASYAMASLVAFSRLNHDAHYASDVFFGAVLGITIGKTIVSLHQQRNRKRLQITLKNDGKSIGWRLTFMGW